MDTERIDGVACAAADLTARLHAELTQAQAELAITDARAHASLAQGQQIPADVRAERTMHRQKVDVLHQLLDGIPPIEGDCHVASA